MRLAAERHDGRTLLEYVVLIVALLSEAIHAVPVEKAAGLLGALYSSADATVMDAPRTEYLINQLRPRAVVGVRPPSGRSPTSPRTSSPIATTTSPWS